MTGRKGLYCLVAFCALTTVGLSAPKHPSHLGRPHHPGSDSVPHAKHPTPLGRPHQLPGHQGRVKVDPHPDVVPPAQHSTDQGHQDSVPPAKHASHLGRPKHQFDDSNLNPAPLAVKPKSTSDTSEQVTQEEPWRICYYSNWSQYRPEPGQFWPEDMDPTYCTHFYYAFSDMEGNDLTFYELNDEDLFGRINAWKVSYPQLKTVLCVGGWTFGTSKMTLMLSSKENRTEFISNVISYLERYNFNGIDLDFEYPGSRGSPPEDKYLFTCLCRELRNAFDIYNGNNPLNQLSFTAGVAAGDSTIRAGYEIEAISSYLDKVVLMSYDFFGAFDEVAWPHSPLDNHPTMTGEDLLKNDKSAVSTWLNGGCPAHKLVLGLATYGRGITLQDENDNGLGAPKGAPSVRGNYTGTLGFQAYYELCSAWEPGATVTYDQFMRVPWGYNGRQWFGYENVQSILEKVQYVKELGLGGVMIWTMDDDDFTDGGSFCGQGKYPIIRAISQSLDGYLVTVPDRTIPDTSFCVGRPDGYYEDPYTCERYYQCSGESTTVGVCQEGTIYDPFFKGCRVPAEMDQTWLCNNCFTYCDRMACDV